MEGTDRKREMEREKRGGAKMRGQERKRSEGWEAETGEDRAIAHERFICLLVS